MNKVIRFLPYTKYHARKQIGSTKIRVENLIKCWPEADIYKYGEKPDAIIFQKVYVQPDFDFPLYFDGIKILDICDPDWLEGQNIKQTIDAMDAVVVPTEELKRFIGQMTDKPVRVIKDRFDLSEFPAKPKSHIRQAKDLVWFGYSQNIRKLKGAINAIKELNLRLTIISNKDPNFPAWAEAINFNLENYEYLPYNQSEIYYQLTKYDIAVLPMGTEPPDRFKSDNKDIIANLCGLPVVKNREELEKMLDPKERNKEVVKKFAMAQKEYDVNLSIEEYKDLISELKTNRR